MQGENVPLIKDKATAKFAGPPSGVGRNIYHVRQVRRRFYLRLKNVERKNQRIARGRRRSVFRLLSYETVVTCGYGKVNGDVARLRADT